MACIGHTIAMRPFLLSVGRPPGGRPHIQHSGQRSHYRHVHHLIGTSAHKATTKAPLPEQQAAVPAKTLFDETSIPNGQNSSTTIILPEMARCPRRKSGTGIRRPQPAGSTLQPSYAPTPTRSQPSTPASARYKPSSDCNSTALFKAYWAIASHSPPLVSVIRRRRNVILYRYLQK